MDFAADTREEYQKALDQLERLPIIGNHSVGQLAISVSYKRWTVSDGHGNSWEAAARSGAAIRTGIRKAFLKWLDLKFGQLGSAAGNTTC